MAGTINLTVACPPGDYPLTPANTPSDHCVFLSVAKWTIVLPSGRYTSLPIGQYTLVRFHTREFPGLLTVCVALAAGTYNFSSGVGSLTVDANGLAAGYWELN